MRITEKGEERYNGTRPVAMFFNRLGDKRHSISYGHETGSSLDEERTFFMQTVFPDLVLYMDGNRVSVCEENGDTYYICSCDTYLPNVWWCDHGSAAYAEYKRRKRPGADTEEW